MAAKPKAPRIGGKQAYYGEAMHTVTFKATREQHETLKALGGARYLREQLDRMTEFFRRRDGR